MPKAEESMAEEPVSTGPALSLCMIVKNEAAVLPRCLRSVRDIVDDLVVVDTGSTDETASIAAEFGARVFDFAWVDDFSRARNFSLDQARGGWVLVMDADESVAAEDHRRIRTALQRRDVDAVAPILRYYVRQIVSGWQPGPGGYKEGEPYPGYFDVHYRRLIRNRPWIRYVHRVHESVVSLDPSIRLSHAEEDWVIHHYGKTAAPEVLRAKANKYLEMNRAKVQENPRSVLAHYELGLQYGELDRFGPAVACFARVEELEPGFRDTRLQMARCQAALGQRAEALHTLRQTALTRSDRDAEIAFEEGNVLRGLGEDGAAEQAYLHALDVNPAFVPARVNLALAYQKGRRSDAALATLDSGLALTPHSPPLLALRARLRLDRRAYADALADLDQIRQPDDNAARMRAWALVGLGRYDEAGRALDRLETSADPEALSLKAMLSLHTGEIGVALRSLCQAAALAWNRRRGRTASSSPLTS
jgi:tetratricopeptide (TPR) repeat protein